MKKITLIIFFILLAVPAAASMMWTSTAVKPKVTLKYINPYNGSVVMKNYSSTDSTFFEMHRDTSNRHYVYVRAENQSGMVLVLRGLGVGVTKTTGATDALLSRQNLDVQMDFAGIGLSLTPDASTMPDAVNMKVKYTLPSGGRCSGSITITAAGMLNHYGDSVPAVATITQTFKDLETQPSIYGDYDFKNNFIPNGFSTQPPEAAGIEHTIDFGTEKDIEFLLGATSFQEPDDLKVIILSDDRPSNGTIGTVDTSGVATYTPNSGFDGVDVLHYTVKDIAGFESPTYRVIMTVSPKPDAEDVIQKIRKDSPATLLSFATLGNLGTGVRYSVPTGGTSGGSITGNYASGFNYTPTSGFTGKDEFSYTLTAVDTAWTATGKFIVQVCPIAVEDFVVLERTADNTNITVLANDIATTGDTLEVVSVKAASSGAVVVNADKATINYNLTNGDPATEDSFTYVIKEVTSGKTSAGTVKIKIQ